MTCQQKKDQRQKKLTDPSPLQVPSRRWGLVATDFIVELHRTPAGFDAITNYVDRLSRRVHFAPSKTTDTAVEAADAFFSNVFKHHGLPDDIVSDRDAKFTSRFWNELMKLCGIRTNISTSYHPQTDGVSEIMNRMVENFLRFYCSLRKNDWDRILPAAAFAYNCA